MAVLLVELQGRRRGAVLPRRILIGRRSMNHLVIGSSAVSRIHAWIEGHGDTFHISDAGSRTGTFVNRQRVTMHHPLHDADVIQIGPAKLLFRSADEVPAGIALLDLPAQPAIAQEDDGIPFDCPACGAPLWATPNMAGGRGQCKYCAENLVVPTSSSVTPSPHRPITPSLLPRIPASPRPRVPAPPISPSFRAAVCGICHSSISASEATINCPSCSLLFHADCWQENYGCSSYGCVQVNVLRPPEASAPGDALATADADAGVAAELEPPARFPWEFVHLAGSVVSALLGALAFGLPSLALVGGSVIYIARNRGKQDKAQKRIILLSTALSVVGIVTGAAVSWFLYFGLPRI